MSDSVVKRATCCRQYQALLRKNYILKVSTRHAHAAVHWRSQKREWVSSCLEILIPPLLMLVNLGIRSAFPIDNSPASTSTSVCPVRPAHDSFSPHEAADELRAEFVGVDELRSEIQTCTANET